MKKNIVIILLFLLSIFSILFFENKNIKKMVNSEILNNNDLLKKFQASDESSTKIDIEEHLIFRPNFDKIFDTIEDGEITWLLTNGGVIKYNRDKKNVKFFSIKEGLAINLYYYDFNKYNFIKRGNYIWIATPGFGISRIDIKNEKIKNYINENTSQNDISTNFKYNIVIGLASNNGLKLYLDPYTNDLWTISSNGISKYLDDDDKWISYGKVENVDIGPVNNIIFNKDFVIAAIDHWTANTGGIVAFDKAENNWLLLSNKNGFDIQQNENNQILASDDSFWVTPPSAYGYCDGNNAVKIYKVLSYKKEAGWKDLKEIDDNIAIGDDLVEMNYKNNILTVFLRKASCGDGYSKVRFIKYDVLENKILEINNVDNYNNEKQQNEKDIENKYSKIVKEIENILKEPARKDVVINIGNDLLISVMSDFLSNQEFDYMQFNSEFKEDSKANISWLDLKNKTYDFLNKNNIQRNLVPLKCNRFNGVDDDIYLALGFAGVEGDTSEIIAKYSKAQKNIVFQDAIKYKNKDGNEKNIIFDYYSTDTLFYCNGNHFLISSSDGVVEYDINTKKGFLFDQANFKGIYKDFDVMKNNLYFLTNNNELGIFNIDNLKYSYIDLTDYKKNAPSIDKIKLVDASGDNFYFNAPMADDNNTQEYLFIFNKKDKIWDKIKITEKTGYVTDAKYFKGMLWVTTTEGTREKIIYTIDQEKNKRKLKINNGIIASGNNFFSNDLIFTTDNELYINDKNGLWEFH